MSEVQGRASTSESVETAIERDGKIGEPPAPFDAESKNKAARPPFRRRAENLFVPAK
jgi:hypothetical protein